MGTEVLFVCGKCKKEKIGVEIAFILATFLTIFGFFKSIW